MGVIILAMLCYVISKIGINILFLIFDNKKEK